MFHRLMKYVPWFLAALFLYSGGFKVLFPGEAELALQTLGFGSRVAAMAVAIATVAEIYLGILLALRLDLRYSIGCSILMLSVFTAYLFYLSTLAHPPTCGCIGLTGIFTSNKQA